MQMDTELTWNGPAIGLLDLDAFFASVEQLLHPEWKSKPVIVGGDCERRGVVSTASYEARAYGVHSAMSSAAAKRLCPNGIWVHPHFDEYKKYSECVMDILLRETPLVEQVSIDEAFFDITPGTYSDERPEAICMRVQSRVQELGITCSIGLSTTKSVAKIASDMDKPNGLYIVPQESVRAFLAPLPVRALSGVGKATEHKLHSLHVFTLKDLALAPPDMIQEHLGKHGRVLQDHALGIDDASVSAQAEVSELKSISKEHTFARDMSDKETLLRAINSLCDALSARLRAKQRCAWRVGIKLKTADFHVKTTQVKLRGPEDKEGALKEAAEELFCKAWSPGAAIRLVGVEFSHLVPKEAPRQLVLGEKDERDVSLVKDEIRQRFGKDALKAGRDLRLAAEDVPKPRDEV